MFNRLARPVMGRMPTSISQPPQLAFTSLARNTFNRSQKAKFTTTITKSVTPQTPTLITAPHTTQQRTFFKWWRLRKQHMDSEVVPDPYYGKYTPRTDPIPDGYWTQNPYGKPYFVGHTPQIENLMKQAKDLKLYDGREHPCNPLREKDPWDYLTMGLPGKYFGYALFGFWFWLFYDLKGRSSLQGMYNKIWRGLYLTQLDRFYPTNFFPTVEWPQFLLPPQPTSLLPAVTEADIEKFNAPKPVETKEEGGAVVVEAKH